MESIIKKIYYGDLRPCEEKAPSTEKYIKNRNDICTIENEILQKYPKCDELLLRYKDALRAESQYECEADFGRGFKLGVLLMIDAISKD